MITKTSNGKVIKFVGVPFVSGVVGVEVVVEVIVGVEVVGDVGVGDGFGEAEVEV